MKTYLKLTFYHEQAIAKIFITQTARTEAQSTEFKEMPDATVMHACVIGEWSKRQLIVKLSGVVLDCMDSWPLPFFLLLMWPVPWSMPLEHKFNFKGD